ncbi:MAG: hypothetical protein A2Y84_00440 [Candidatus Colwellbacteria bacterium RBG_13_48_8]|uniref:HTH HARE-type domain-containing protein n=1 Tax=Candidatus Colwellbacteria bacterium RBG_13_48_8 TaxID=1797685 RepID=A0A1G1YXV0_9BACT|nr:MAG: hypothetical protein A2Y84_00440 [Candidatus Colwellbacteria bacterium RBG_13_48_8]
MSKIVVEIDIDEIIRKALEIEDKRARNIVVHRFGLKSPSKKTLASLGEEYNLTRERVRQIESVALKNIRTRIAEEKRIISLLELTESYLNDLAGLRRSDFLAKDIALLCGAHKDYDPVFENKLNFIARVVGRPQVIGETPSTHTFWYLDHKIQRLALSLVQKLLGTKERSFDKYLEAVQKEYKLPEPTILNYLSISKNFGVGPYGHIGADHWLDVNPRTVRDKAYLVLRQSGQPMHFREIAESVNQISGRKNAHATVHNELIRDPRFVLTGRGTYSLNE